MRRGRLAGAVATAVVCGLLSSCTGYGNASLGPNTLTISGDAGNPVLVENFNPFLSSHLGGSLVLYEPLEVQNAVNGSFTPFLATGFTDPSPTTVDFTMRSGVQWSDGAPLTAADVVFTYDLLKRYPALDTTGIWEQVRSVAASGDHVLVQFKAPDVPFIGTVANVPIVPRHLWASVKDPTKFANTHPVGSGPFVLTHFAPTRYVMDRNPRYWDAAAVAPARIVYPATSSNNSTTQLDIVIGQFDWAYSFLPDISKTYVERDPARNTYWFPPGGAIGLYLNLTKAPFDEVAFRRGISDSLDRTVIADKAVNGYESQASQSGLILPNLEKWLDPSLADRGYVTQDRTRALSEFAAAGYHLRHGRLVGPDGKAFSMTITTPSGYSDWVAATKEVANELAAVGIAVTLNLPEAAQATQATDSGDFDAAFGSFGGTGVPYSDYSNSLNASYATPIGKLTTENFERYRNPAVQRQLAVLAAATSPTTQHRAVDALQQIMVTDVPVILLYNGGSWGIFSTRNYTGWPSAAHPYALPTSYNSQILVVLSHLKKA